MGTLMEFSLPPYPRGRLTVGIRGERETVMTSVGRRSREQRKAPCPAVNFYLAATHAAAEEFRRKARDAYNAL